jgi:hypothetical protein
MSEAVFEPTLPGSRARTFCSYDASPSERWGNLVGGLSVTFPLSAVLRDADSELLGQPVFMGSENRLVRASQDHQEGLPSVRKELDSTESAPSPRTPTPHCDWSKAKSSLLSFVSDWLQHEPGT